MAEHAQRCRRRVQGKFGRQRLTAPRWARTVEGLHVIAKKLRKFVKSLGGKLVDDYPGIAKINGMLEAGDFTLVAALVRAIFAKFSNRDFMSKLIQAPHSHASLWEALAKFIPTLLVDLHFNLRIQATEIESYQPRLMETLSNVFLGSSGATKRSQIWLRTTI